MRLVCLDIESTGVDVDQDRIVEMAMTEVHPLADWTDCPRQVWRVNPGVPIPAEATAVHKIGDEDVACCERFAHHAPEVQRWVDGAVLVTFNGHKFDVVLLDAELRRAGQPGIDLETVREIDVWRCVQELDPNTLEGVYQRYFGEPLEGAHGALADVAATVKVLRHLVGAHWQGFAVTLGGLEAMARPVEEVDRDGFLERDAEGVVRFRRGKHKGEAAKDHPDYLGFVLDAVEHEGEFSPRIAAAVERVIADHDLGQLVPRRVDVGGFFHQLGGRVVFANGKHQGDEVREHPDFVGWILDQSDASDEEKSHVEHVARWLELDVPRRVDEGGKFYRKADGVVRFAFGKHKDLPAESQVGYCYWMANRADFPDDTKAVALRIAEGR